MNIKIISKKIVIIVFLLSIIIIILLIKNCYKKNFSRQNQFVKIDSLQIFSSDTSRESNALLEYDLPPTPIGGVEMITRNIKYPAAALKAKKEAIVRIRISVSAAGKLVNVEIIEIAGDTKYSFGEAALNALKMVSWKPAIKNDQPVFGQCDIPVEFNLSQTQSDNTDTTNSSLFPNADSLSQDSNYDTPPAPVGGYATIQNNLVFPEEALKNEVEKKIFIKVLINANGEMAASEILNPNPDDRYAFNEAALSALKKVRWEPAQKNGKPVQSSIIVPVNFKFSQIANLTNPLDSLSTQQIHQSTYLPPYPVSGYSSILRNLIYPEIARINGIQGRVIIKVIIDNQGEIILTSVLKSLGHYGCDETAISAIRNVKWNSALLDNEPIKASVAVKINFMLTESVIPQKISPNDIRTNILVKIVIDDSGKAITIEPAQKLDNKLRESIIDKINQMHFKPAEPGSRQSNWISVPITTNFATYLVGTNFDSSTGINSNLAEEINDAYDEPPRPKDGFESIQKILKIPKIAQKAGITGIVLIKVVIDANGRLSETKIINSIGNKECDTAALEAIKGIKWDPARQGNKSVKAMISVPVRFNL